MRTASVLALLKAYGIDLSETTQALSALDLLANFQRAKDERERAQVVKTALRSLLPFPFSLAAGEILVRLRKVKQLRALDQAIRKGL